MSWYVYVFIVFAVLTFSIAAYHMQSGRVHRCAGSLMASAFWCFWIWVCLK
jgi:hypothetical protein